MNPESSEPSLYDIAAATRYPLDAFHFVRCGLDFTVRRMHADPEMLEEAERHVTGKDLCEGLRDFAIQQYGCMARMMLRRWNVNRTEDFGHIVFAMVEADLMQATDEDSISDFSGGYDFDDAFDVVIPVDEVEAENAITGNLGHD